MRFIRGWTMSRVRDSYWLVSSICCFETDEHMHIHVIRWRQRLDYPERLGGDRWMRETAAAYSDIDSDAVIIGTGDLVITMTGDHTTWTGDSTTGTGYRTTGTTGTRWRSCTAKAVQGGW
ncbi:hypothetical protein Tco_0690112 [Tanacetum coccineum]